MIIIIFVKSKSECILYVFLFKECWQFAVEGVRIFQPESFGPFWRVSFQQEEPRSGRTAVAGIHYLDGWSEQTLK